MTQRQRLSVFDLVDKFKDTIMGPAEPDLFSLVQISFKYFHFIIYQMDSLDLHVEESELRDLDADVENTSIFQKGMACPVPQCTYTGNFGNYSKLKRHWNDLHEPMTTLQRCSRCGKVFKNGKWELKRHLVRFHQIKPEEVTEKMENSLYVKINNKYIHPGSIAIPTLQPSVNVQRREEQERRRRLLAEIQDSPMYLQNTLTCEMDDVLSLK